MEDRQPTRNGMGMYQTRSSVISRGLPDQTVNVQELKDKFTELGLSLHQPRCPHLLSSVHKRLPEGVSITDLPAGITDEDLKYIHAKGQAADDEVVSGEDGSVVSACHTRADSLDGDSGDLLLPPPATDTGRSDVCDVSHADRIDGASCGSVKDLCKKFNSQPDIVEEWMEDGKVRESVLAVMQVASSVAMCCGGSGVPLLDTPHRGPIPHPSPKGGVHGGGTEASGGLPDITDCQVSVRSLKKMFDDGEAAAAMEEEPMEICTRL